MIELISIIYRKRQGVFIDIGANVGQSLLKLKSVNPDIGYIGVEPNPACVFYLMQLIKKNKLLNCKVIPVGLFDECGISQMSFYDENEAGCAASLVEGFRTSQKVHHKQIVPVSTFGKIAEVCDVKKINIIKIDVEGAELEVVKSLYEVFLEYRPIVLIEILPVYSKENKIREDRQNKVLEYISRLNYCICRINKSDKDAFIGINELAVIEIHSDLNKCDYVLLPNEIKNDFISIGIIT